MKLVRLPVVKFDKLLIQASCTHDGHILVIGFDTKQHHVYTMYSDDEVAIYNWIEELKEKCRVRKVSSI